MNQIDLLSYWAAAYILALWFALVFWVYRDARERITRPFMQFLATMLVIAFFIPGVLLYLIVRPPKTIEDRYLRTLEEESLLRSIEAHEIIDEE